MYCLSAQHPADQQDAKRGPTQGGMNGRRKGGPLGGETDSPFYSRSTGGPFPARRTADAAASSAAVAAATAAKKVTAAPASFTAVAVPTVETATAAASKAVAVQHQQREACTLQLRRGGGGRQESVC